jgi:hypothetical protein
MDSPILGSITNLPSPANHVFAQHMRWDGAIHAAASSQVQSQTPLQLRPFLTASRLIINHVCGRKANPVKWGGGAELPPKGTDCKKKNRTSSLYDDHSPS